MSLVMACGQEIKDPCCRCSKKRGAGEPEKAGACRSRKRRKSQSNLQVTTEQSTKACLSFSIDHATNGVQIQFCGLEKLDSATEEKWHSGHES